MFSNQIITNNRQKIHFTLYMSLIDCHINLQSFKIIFFSPLTLIIQSFLAFSFIVTKKFPIIPFVRSQFVVQTYSAMVQ